MVDGRDERTDARADVELFTVAIREPVAHAFLGAALPVVELDRIQYLRLALLPVLFQSGHRIVEVDELLRKGGPTDRAVHFHVLLVQWQQVIRHDQ